METALPVSQQDVLLQRQRQQDYMSSTLVQPQQYLRPSSLLQHRPSQHAPDPDNDAYAIYPKNLARASEPHMPPTDYFPENEEPYELGAPPCSPLKRHKTSATQTSSTPGVTLTHSSFPAAFLPSQDMQQTLATQTSNARNAFATQTANVQDAIASQTSVVRGALATQTTGVREAASRQTTGVQEAAGTQTSVPRQQLTTQTSALQDAVATQTSAPTRVLATQTSVAREAFGVQTDALRQAFCTQTSMARDHAASQMGMAPELDASLPPRASVALAAEPALQGTGGPPTLTHPPQRATCHAWSIPAEGGWIFASASSSFSSSPSSYKEVWPHPPHRHHLHAQPLNCSTVYVCF